MGVHEDLTRIIGEPGIRRLALQRAGSRELAEDALQETVLNVAQQDTTKINNVCAYFRTALAREIKHQLARPTPILVEDIASVEERGGAWSDRPPPGSVEHEAEIRQLALKVLSRLDIDRDELMAGVPGRSGDPPHYRSAIVATARAIFLMLLQGSVASADWNVALKHTYAPWFAEAGLAPDAADQRLSRGRFDVRMLLQRLLTREDLGWR